MDVNARAGTVALLLLCAAAVCGSASGASVPPLKWAQRPGAIWITVDIRFAENVQVAFEDDGRVKLSADSAEPGDSKHYELDTKLLKPINASDCTWTRTNRNVELNIKKAKVERRHWARLLADAAEERKLSRLGVLKRDWLRYGDGGDEDGGGVQIKYNSYSGKRWDWWKQGEEEDDVDDEGEL